jgi:imidazolonepropionase
MPTANPDPYTVLLTLAPEAARPRSAADARALRREDVGVLRVGARADLAVLDAPSYRHLAYRPGVPIARTLAV